MKIIIAVLLTIIASIGFFVVYAILSDAGNAHSPSSVEENGNAPAVEEQGEGTLAVINAEPMGNTGADFVIFNVTYSPQDSIYTTPDGESEPARDVVGLVDFNLTLVGTGNVNGSFNISTPVYADEDINVATFVFNYDDTSSIPTISFMPGMYETASLFATYFVDFDITGGSIAPHILTIPMFGSALNTVGGQDSIVIQFVITFGNAQNEATWNLFSIPVSAVSEESPENFRGSIRVLPDEDLMSELLGTWVYRSTDAHIEITFMNDWRYYEIAYSRSGRPLSWEYGVYSIDCNTRITIQSSSIWGPEYTYRFRINNNTMTLTHRGVGYKFTRQNPLPLLSLENFPFSMWQTWERERWPHAVTYEPTGTWSGNE